MSEHSAEKDAGLIERLRRSYELKVQDLAIETLRLSTLREHVERNAVVADLQADATADPYTARELRILADSLRRASSGEGQSPVTSVEPGCTCGGMAACQQCQDRDAIRCERDGGGGGLLLERGVSGEGPSAEKDAAKRGHVLTVTKGEDWFPDQPDWDGSITCLNADRCGGWWECGKPHEIDGVSAADGPYENDCPGEHGVSTDRAGHLPWCDEDEFEFHGVLHTWRWGYGWTVPYSGCVVQTSDAVSDAAHDIGQQHGEGSYLVDDEWDDTSCTLIYAERVLPPGEGRSG